MRSNGVKLVGMENDGNGGFGQTKKGKSIVAMKYGSKTGAKQGVECVCGQTAPLWLCVAK